MPKKQKFEYIIIGSDNHWYASCLNSLAEAKAEIILIKKKIHFYGQDEVPEKLYIYKATEIDVIYT